MLAYTFFLLSLVAFSIAQVSISTRKSTEGRIRGSLKGDSPILTSSSSSSALFAKKRRSKAKVQVKAPSLVANESPLPIVTDKVLSQGTVGGEPFVVPDLQKTDSKLQPLSGTAEAKKQAFEEGTNGFERFIDRMTAPTPKGKEPEAVKLVKQITWGAVLVLVLIEIYVSIKVGGAPFDIDKISTPSLPSLPNFKAFTGGAGPLTP